MTEGALKFVIFGLRPYTEAPAGSHFTAPYSLITQLYKSTGPGPRGTIILEETQFKITKHEKI